MKKSLIYLSALLGVMLFTACNSGDDPVNKQTLSLVFNSRMSGNGSNPIVFSQATGQMEINYTDQNIKFTIPYKNLDSVQATLTTPLLAMEHYSGTVYRLRSQESQVISALSGFIDLSTGMTWLKQSGDHQGSTLLATTQLVYAYLTTTVTDQEGKTYSHDQSGYIFALNSKGETAMMEVTSFIPDTGGAIQASVLDYEGLKVTITPDGYHITAPEAICKQATYYNVTDLDVNVTDDGMYINGSYKMKDNTYKMTGRLFPAQN